MQFEGRRRTSHYPNLTPLIDIVFLLLVFFMLSSHFVRDQAIAIELPQTQHNTLLSQDGYLEIIISEKGEYFIAEQNVSSTQLEQTLVNALKRQKQKIIRIRGDQQSQLQATITVFDTAKKAGATSVEFITTADWKQRTKTQTLHSNSAHSLSEF